MCLPRVCVNCDKPQAQTRHRAPYSSAELSVPGAQSKSDITLAATKSMYKKNINMLKINALFVSENIFCTFSQWEEIFEFGQ